VFYRISLRTSWTEVVPPLYIISGTGVAICSKTNFEPTNHHHPRSSPLPCMCIIPSVSAIFKYVLEVVFVRVFSTACDSAFIISVVSKQRETDKLQGHSHASRVGGG
jgi:hypothetical protein